VQPGERAMQERGMRPRIDGLLQGNTLYTATRRHLMITDDLRVIVFHANRLVRDSIAFVLGQQKGFSVVGLAARAPHQFRADVSAPRSGSPSLR
jgi:hypothetical protein